MKRMLVLRTSITDSSSSFQPEVLDPLIEPIPEVGPQVTGKASGTQVLYLFGFGDCARLEGFHWGTPMHDLPIFGRLIGVRGKQVLDYAVYDACLKGKADFLVAPRYAITEENDIFRKKYTVTVSGYAGRYAGFEPIKYEKRHEWKLEEGTKRMAVSGSGQAALNITVKAQ